MTKIRISGELFAYDRNYRPMAEMLDLEKALNCTYGQWESDLQAGSARALAGLIWLVWRRDGRDVSFEDVAGSDVNLTEISFEDEEPPDPTTAPSTKGASPSTGRVTSGRSPKSST